MLISIASFDLLPTDKFNEKFFNFTDDSTLPYNIYFETQGFKTVKVISNIGSTFYYFMISIFMILIYFLLDLCKKN